jgi:capsular exopolysaccharide synthesis family protein
VELADYLGVLRRRWWMVAVAILLSTTGAGVFSSLQTPMYTSTLRLLVPTGANPTASGRQEASSAAELYAQFATTPPAVSQAIAAAGAQRTPVAVTSSADGATPFFDIVVASSKPAVAQAVAQSYITLLPKIVITLQDDPQAAPPKFTLVQSPIRPDKPSSPKPVRNVLIGAALGLILGAATATLREALDGRVRDGLQLERTANVALLGMVPKEFRGTSVPAMSRPKSRRAEAYRAVRTNLEFLTAQGMPRSVVVTSAAAGEGKSSLTANLGIVASRAGRDVVIVDADLRKPTVAKYFDLDSPIGLTDVLTGRWSTDEALQQVSGERLSVISSGPVPSAPGELVGSRAMANLIDELEDRFDFVIIDTPPILPVADGLSLAVNVDGVLLVARMRETTKRSLQKATAAIGRVNATLMGVVGNAALSTLEDPTYAYYRDGYLSKSKEKKAGRSETTQEVQALEAAGRRTRIQDRRGVELRPSREMRPLQREQLQSAPPPIRTPSPTITPSSARTSSTDDTAPRGIPLAGVRPRVALPAAEETTNHAALNGNSPMTLRPRRSNSWSTRPDDRRNE